MIGVNVKGASKVKTEYFDDTASFLSYLEKGEPKWGFSSTVEHWDHNWTFGVNYERAIDLARFGWDEGTEKFNGLVMEAESKGLKEGKKTQTEYAPAGAYPDVPLFLSGSPCHMANEIECPETVHRIARIKINAGASSNVKGKTIQNYGAAICVLIDSLEANETRVELIYSSPVDSMRGLSVIDSFNTEICLKQAHESLSISALAFWLSHPAAKRRLIFRHREIAFPSIHEYGSPTDLPKEEGTFIIPKLNETFCSSLGGAINWINETWQANC